MVSRELLQQLRETFAAEVLQADLPGPRRLFAWIEPAAVPALALHLTRILGARYVVSVGADERPARGCFLVAHNFAFDGHRVLASFLAELPADHPRIPSISSAVPGANWAEREFQDLVGIEPVGHVYPKRLILPDGWPEDAYPLRKDVPHDFVPPGYDPDRDFPFDEAPPGCVVVPFGPFHPSLDEPAHFRLYVDGEYVRGCEYRGFMAHRGIEKLAETVLGYNDIPVAAERICGICGCVHSVAYVQAVEEAIAHPPPPRAEYIRTILLELERLHSHLLWVGLACHIIGFDSLFMQAFRIREPVMAVAEEITGNRKTYGLCVVGGVRWDLTPDHRLRLQAVLGRLESEWRRLADAILADRNIRARTAGIGLAPPELVREFSLVGPVARAAGVPIDARRDHPYAAYERVDFEVITADGADVWSRIVVRAREVFESIRIMRQCLDKLEPGPLVNPVVADPPAGRLGLSSVEAPRGESHHFVITGDDRRPRRWRVRAPTYQNLQAVPRMIRDQQLADMTIALGSIDPCFSCTDRLETIDIRSRLVRTWKAADLEHLAREAHRNRMRPAPPAGPPGHTTGAPP